MLWTTIWTALFLFLATVRGQLNWPEIENRILAAANLDPNEEKFSVQATTLPEVESPDRKFELIDALWKSSGKRSLKSLATSKMGAHVIWFAELEKQKKVFSLKLQNILKNDPKYSRIVVLTTTEGVWVYGLEHDVEKAICAKPDNPTGEEKLSSNSKSF